MVAHIGTIAASHVAKGQHVANRDPPTLIRRIRPPTPIYAATIDKGTIRRTHVFELPSSAFAAVQRGFFISLYRGILNHSEVPLQFHRLGSLVHYEPPDLVIKGGTPRV